MKKLVWLVQYTVYSDERNYRDDREGERFMFYGDEQAINDELAKRNQPSIDNEIKTLQNALTSNKAIINNYKKAKKLRDSLPNDQKDFVQLTDWMAKAAEKFVAEFPAKLESIQKNAADYYPDKDYTDYWTLHEFGLEGSNIEWAYDEVGNMIGFTEKREPA